MLDRQLDRRSPNKKKRTYVIGRRFLVEKTVQGGDRDQKPQNGAFAPVGKTSIRIATQLGIGKNTVERAAEFTLAVDTIVRVTECKINDLLDDKIKATMDDIKTFAGLIKTISPVW